MSAAFASAQAMKEGKTITEAEQAGKYAAMATTKTFAEMAKSGCGRGTNAAAGSGTAAAAAGNGEGNVSPGATNPNIAAQWLTVERKKKKTLVSKSPYAPGKGLTMTAGSKSFTLPPQIRPEYLSNKCEIIG